MAKLYKRVNSKLHKALVSLFLLLILTSGYAHQRWSSDQLLEDRELNLAVATVGNNIVFFSGYKKEENSSVVSNSMEIHNIRTGEKELLEVPEGAGGGRAVSGSIGSKVFFAGGWAVGYQRLDIYDTLTGEWSYSDMPEPKAHHAIATWGNKLYIGGGWYDGSTYETMNIYDIKADIWNTKQFIWWGGGAGGVS